MNLEENSLKGKRYYCFARCSTNEQSETSLPDQLKLLRDFGDQHGMIYVGHIERDVTGSIPGARTEFDALIVKKRSNDFDVLLVQDISRLTRAGAEHGHAIEFQLRGAGIEVIYVADRLPQGDHTSILKSVGFYAAQQYAKSLSFAVARGMMSSIENGRIGHCICPPYGTDRLMVSMDDKPLHVIRNLDDGTQQRLDPENGKVLETYPASSRAHYRQQANERAVLIPGEPRRVEAVTLMFRRCLIDGWSGHRIANELEQLGYKSRIGKPWCVTSINRLLRNPIYTGVGIANRYTNSVYNIRSKNSPRPATPIALADHKRPPLQVRPRSEWIEIEQPLMKEFLGDLREAAVTWQKKELEKEARGHIPTPVSKNNRNVDSRYLLSGILRGKQGNAPMSGRCQGPQANQIRYYGMNRGFTVPRNDPTLRRLIPAEPIERAVIDVLRQTLLTAPDLRERLVALVKRQQAAMSKDAGEIQSLEKERDKLTRRIEAAIDALGEVGQQAAKGKLRELEARLAAVVRRIEQARAVDTPIVANPEKLADGILKRLQDLGSRLDIMPVAALRQILRLFISKAEVDLVTKEVELELAIPDWTAIGEFDPNVGMGLSNTSAQNHVGQAHRVHEVKLAVSRCQIRKRSTPRGYPRPPCYECERRKAA